MYDCYYKLSFLYHQSFTEKQTTEFDSHKMVITFLPIRNTIHKIKPISPPRMETSLKFVQMYLFSQCTHKIEVLCVIITNIKFHAWKTSKRVSFDKSFFLKKNTNKLRVATFCPCCIPQLHRLRRKMQRFCFWERTFVYDCCRSIRELRARQSEHWHTQPQNITCLNATNSETWRSHGASLKVAVLWCDDAWTHIN
jgi:hypothetical protein